jgi:hypothetical protein
VFADAQHSLTSARSNQLLREGAAVCKPYISSTKAIQLRNCTERDILAAVPYFNTFTAKIDHSQFNNSCLRLLAPTLVDLIFQSCCFSLGGKLVQQLQYIWLMLSLSFL